MSESAQITLRVRKDVPFAIVPVVTGYTADGQAITRRAKVRAGMEYPHRGHPGCLPRHSEVVEDPRTKKQQEADAAEWAEYAKKVREAVKASQPAPTPPHQPVVAAKKPGRKPSREDLPGQGPDIPEVQSAPLPGQVAPQA